MTTSTKEAAARAASATLAGALAVGMVPAAALAAEAPEEGAGDGIEALTATVVNEYANAKISQIKLNGSTVATPTGKIEIASGTTNLDVYPTQLKSSVTGNTLDLLDKEGDLLDGLEIVYEGGSIPEGGQSTMPAAIGSYTVQVVGKDKVKDSEDKEVDGPYAGLKSAKLSFSIVGKSLDGATLYEVNDKAGDVSDTTFTFNGSSLNIGVALNGSALDKTTDAKDPKDYTISYRNADGSAAATPMNAGSYIAVIEGTGDYEGSEAQVKFTVGKLDLSSADVVLNDVTYSAGTDAKTTVSSISGVPSVDALDGMLKYTYPVVPTKIGSYQVTIAPTKDAETNITGTKTASYNVVTSSDVLVQYNGGDFDKQTFNINLSNGEAFALSKLKVYNGTQNTDPELKSEEYTVTVTDQKGNAVDASKLSTPGKWTVTVAVNSAAMDYALGGKKTCTVNVTNGTIGAANMFVTYKGKAGKAFTETYSGDNYLSDVAVKVVVGDKTLTEGVDYKVSYLNSKNEEVTEFVNADDYQIKITSDTWTVAAENKANICDFKINKVQIAIGDIEVADTVKLDTGEVDTDKKPIYATGLPYTGSEITPTFKYKVKKVDGNYAKDAKGNQIYADLPAGAYKIASITKDGKAAKIVEVGDYSVKLANNTDEPINYAIDGVETAITVKVIDNKVFQDVPADAWYAQVVADAAEAKIMNGYSGTNLFGPNDQITRGQVACVLFNMAGGTAGGKDDNQVNDFTGYPSFKDVDSHAYYAQAIAWAKDAKIVNGYDDGTFRPDQNVTREEFACMLWNYAKANLSSTVKDIDVATALASKPDGAKVSGWAKEGVAWAVQNKIMGNGGVITPAGKVTRAETAAMAMNYIGLNK